MTFTYTHGINGSLIQGHGLFVIHTQRAHIHHIINGALIQTLISTKCLHRAEYFIIACHIVPDNATLLAIKRDGWDLPHSLHDTPSPAGVTTNIVTIGLNVQLSRLHWLQRRCVPYVQTSQSVPNWLRQMGSGIYLTVRITSHHKWGTVAFFPAGNIADDRFLDPGLEETPIFPVLNLSLKLQHSSTKTCHGDLPEKLAVSVGRVSHGVIALILVSITVLIHFIFPSPGRWSRQKKLTPSKGTDLVFIFVFLVFIGFFYSLLSIFLSLHTPTRVQVLLPISTSTASS